MARGPLKQETKQRRALAKAAEVLGMTVEELQEEIPEPVETDESKMLEAQSVVEYFQVRGAGFRHAVCEVCKLTFAYRWHITGVKCCSVPCMAKKLESMGLKWDPRREPERRWGYIVPAIVPAYALEKIQLPPDETLKDPLNNSTP